MTDDKQLDLGPEIAAIDKANRATDKKNKAKKQAKKTHKTKRIVRNFPAGPFEDSLTFASHILRIAAGQPIRRLRLFDELGKSPDSSASRQLIVNSSKYGLTKGSYAADFIELTTEGRTATSEDVSEPDRLSARFKLAIESITPFKAIYDRLKEGKLPAVSVIRDFLVELGYKEEEVPECVDTFIVNAKFLGLLRTIAGAERLLPIEHILEEVPRGVAKKPSIAQVVPTPVAESGEWDKICFYITPIGEEDTEQRRHSDLFLNHIVEPALEEFGLKLVRADQIGKPGMITGQVIEHTVRARLVIADLSFQNPNVFYELCLRHVCRLPIVQIIRKKDDIPFDLEQFRTIPIDNSDIYTLVPQLETYQSQIAAQVRQALENPDAVDNPISVYFPGLSATVPPLKRAAATEPIHMTKSASAS